MPEKQANKPNKSSYLLFVPDSGQKLSIINQDGANSAPLYYHQRVVDQQITDRMSLAMNRRITTQISEQMSQEVVQPIMTQFSRQILQQMSPEILVPKSSPLTLQKS